MIKQSEALWLADELDVRNFEYMHHAAIELRRLHEVNAELLEALLEGARRSENLKRETGTNPESPIAIQNGRYMSISYFLRAAIAKATGETE